MIYIEKKYLWYLFVSFINLKTHVKLRLYKGLALENVTGEKTQDGHCDLVFKSIFLFPKGMIRLKNR